jgi:hypothetical protein
MIEFCFGLHFGHLIDRADRIAKSRGARHVNYTEPNGERRGWFVCPNLGTPFDQERADQVLADIERIGGIEALREPE